MAVAPDTQSSDAARAVRFAVAAADDAYAAALVKALKSSFSWGKRGYAVSFETRQDAGIVVYAFAASDVDRSSFLSDTAPIVATDKATVKIFLEIPSFARSGQALQETEHRNAIIAQLADRNAGYVVPLLSKFLRWETATLLEPSGMPTRKGFDAIASAIAKYVDLQVVRRNLAGLHAHQAAGQSIRPPRGLERFARALGRPAERVLGKTMSLLARSPAPVSNIQPGGGSARKISVPDILGEFPADVGAVPESMRGNFDLESVECFVDGRLFFASYPNWGRVPFFDPMDWSMGGPNRSWRAYFLGLEFLNPVLNYLLAGESDDAGEIRAFLKRRGIDDDALLTRAGAVIASFVAQNPPDAPRAQRAWHEGTVSRRLKNLLLFLLCARRAAEHGYEPDAQAVHLAHSSVMDCIAFLRSDDVYIKSGNHGVRQDLLLVRTGLLMRGSAFGRELISHGLERLARYQLKTAITSDGVWMENSFAYHCSVMRSLTRLARDLEAAQVAPDPFLLDAIARMSIFAEAMIKCDGQGPLLGDTEPRSFADALIAAQNLRADEYANPHEERRRSKSTYVFQDGGYFASHTDTALDCRGSSLLLTANLRDPKHKQADDLSVIFSHGAVDLLIDGGAFNKETSDKIRNAARFDAATHNSYRVNGNSYTIGTARAKSIAAVEKMWEGDGWAACLATNDAFAEAHIARLAIHLKRHHALVVVDRLRSRNHQTCLFEQFWHIAPQFRRAEYSGTTLLDFVSPADGHLLVAFDNGDATLSEGFGSESDSLAWLMIGRGKIVPTPYLSRARTLKQGFMAAHFHWSLQAGSTHVALDPISKDGVRISATAQGYSAAFTFERESLACVALSS